ncbi:MAG: hypothetical protein IIA67_07285 [Planctomycetes bacterium]|nr:hypothetical protein [Planctomycetota bacterium]
MSTDPSDDKIEAGKVQGRPKSDAEGNIPRRDFLVWKPFKEWFREKLQLAECLTERLATAKVDQEENKAAQLAADAAEKAARKEETLAKTDIANQQAVQEFTKAVEHIGGLPAGQQEIAFLKLIEKNPNIMEQIDKLDAMFTKLRLLKHANLIELPKQEPARAVAEQGNLIEASVSDGIGLGDKVSAEVKRSNPETATDPS